MTIKINFKKIILTLVIGLIATIVSLFVYGIIHFADGIYAGAEIYRLNYPKESVGNAIAQFKMQHPEMAPPYVTIGNHDRISLDETSGSRGYGIWHSYYYFFLRESDCIYLDKI